jgi:hypothetical protein
MGRVEQKREPGLIQRVDALNEEVRVLALNLAIYLARAKSGSQKLIRLEPDFVRLVNGTVAVVQEIGHILNAARNAETLAYEVPLGTVGRDQIEVRLRSILDQCGRVMSALSKTNDISS